MTYCKYTICIYTSPFQLCTYEATPILIDTANSLLLCQLLKELRGLTDSQGFETVQEDPATQTVDPVHPVPPHCPYLGTALLAGRAATAVVVFATIVGTMILAFGLLKPALSLLLSQYSTLSEMSLSSTNSR